MSKWVDAGENRVANILFRATAVDSSLYLALYTVPTSEPGETAVDTDLTEPSGGAYARIALSRGTWTVTGSAATYAQQTFAASGGAWGNVYGYFVSTGSSGTSSGVLLAVENFSDGPYNIGDGDSIKITPSITVA
jgi:hypothetical protein